MADKIKSPSPPANPRRKRPAIVTIIIVVFILETLSAAVVTLIYAAEAGVFSQQIAQTIRIELSDVQLPDTALDVRAIASGLLLIANLFITIGLIRMHSWAWTGAMVLMGIRLAFGLSDYLFGSPAFDLLIFCVVLVFLLNQHEVRKAFGIIKETHVAAQPVKRANDAIRR